MTSFAPPDRPFRLGPWLVEPRLCSVRSGGCSVHLEPRAMDLLVLLAGRAGDLVAKDEIFAAVWEGRAVSDDVLTGAVSQLRKALGDDARNPTFIETIPKRGYRLLVAVEGAEPAAAPPQVAASPASEVEGEPPAARPAIPEGLDARRPDATSARPHAISARPDAVGDRRSGASAVAPEVPAAERPWRAFRRLPISGRRALGLAAGGLLAAALAAVVWLSVAGGVGAEARQAALAAAACAKGRAALALRSPVALRQAELYFREALAHDARHAPAHAGLADTYGLMVDAGLDSPARLLPLARAAAEAALALDPDLAEARTALAAVLFIHDRDFAAAEREFRYALELAPGHAPAHRLYAYMLSALGRHEEAIREMRLALAADPVSLPAHRDLGEVLLLARRYEAVIAQMRETLTLEPGFPDAHLKLGFAYLYLGREGDAYAAFRTAFEGLGVDPGLLARLDEAFSRQGLRGAFVALGREMDGHAIPGYRPSLTDRAMLYGAMGDVDRALAALEQADARRDPNLLWLAVAPSADPLRGDPRFERLLARLGLPAEPPPPPR